MLSFMRENISVWRRLAQTDKPVVLYGMGDGADKILNICNVCGIHVADIFASDEYVRGHSFRGYKVLKYSDVKEKYADFTVAVAFAVDYDEMLNRIYSIAQEVETVAPHVPLFNDSLFTPSFLTDNAARLEKVYARLADEQSRRVYADILDFKLSGKISYLKDCTTSRIEDIKQILCPNSTESYLDLGAYRGDTVQEFLSLTGGEYDSVIALEPDPKSFVKLEQFCAENKLERILTLNMGVWKEKSTLNFNNRAGRNSSLASDGRVQVQVDSVDNILAGRVATLIKADVEGAEAEMLEGAAETLRKFAPKLFVSAYHYDSDMFRLPEKILELNPEYKIYFRKHPYIPAWETNILATV